MAKAQLPAQEGDLVEILTGDFKGQQGTIMEIDPTNIDGSLQVEIIGVVDTISYHPDDVILLVD